MSVFFVDTSALAKRYLKETGSTWVMNWILPPAGNIIVLTELAIVEMASLLGRHHRSNLLSTANLGVLQANFLVHTEKEYLIVPLESMILVQARALINKYPLRALDAIQLASALQAVALLNQQIIFVSADNNLLSAATAEGFAVDNPLMHP